MTALSTEALDGQAPPPLRLVPAPASAPPFDDEPGGTPVLRLVRSAKALPPVSFDDESWLAAERTPTESLPASHLFAHTLVQGVLEVLAGVRSVKQLQRDTTPELYTSLAEALQHRPRATGSRPDRRAVRSLHVQERPEGVVEVCATVQRGPRFSALALRLEGFDGRWRCVELLGI